MTTKQYRSTEFLRIAMLDDEDNIALDLTQVVNARYVKYVDQSTLSPRKLYSVIFKDFTGATTYGFATPGDLLACGIPLPDCLGYQIELAPALND